MILSQMSSRFAERERQRDRERERQRERERDPIFTIWKHRSYCMQLHNFGAKCVQLICLTCDFSFADLQKNFTDAENAKFVGKIRKVNIFAVYRAI